MLDAASLVLSAVDIPRDTQADLCIRAGYLALRYIASFFECLSYSLNPDPTDPISITRKEFDAACDELAEAGVPHISLDNERIGGAILRPQDCSPYGLSPSR